VKNKKLPPTVFLCVYENKCVCVCECVSVCRSEIFSGLKIVGNASQAKEYENEYEEGWLIWTSCEDLRSRLIYIYSYIEKEISKPLNKMC